MPDATPPSAAPNSPVPSPVPVQAPATLTTAELRAAVHGLAPRIAVFDCDGTLWSGDAGSSFMRWSMENGLLSSQKNAWLQTQYDRYNRGEVGELEICGNMVSCYAGLAVDTMREAAATFFHDRIEPNIFPELQQLITDLQRDGVEIWAVSSTNDWVIEEGVLRFNIPPERVLSARVVVESGIVTGQLIDVPTDGGKVTALHRVGVTAPDAVFGNSVHDAAMLSIARRAFPVNPSPALLTRSAAEGWPVYWPAAVAPST